MGDHDRAIDRLCRGGQSDGNRGRPELPHGVPRWSEQAACGELEFRTGADHQQPFGCGVGTNGQIDVYNYAGNANVDVDVDGYYSGGDYRNRLCFCADYPGAGCGHSHRHRREPEIAASTYVPFHIATSASTIPTTATAVAANFTVVPGASAGYLTVFPTSDSAPPLASDVNWAAQSGPVPNFTVADTNGTGSVDVYNFSDATPINLVVDDFGYFVSTSSGTPSAGGGFHAITCPSTSDCVAVGQGTNGVGLVEVSNNGGASFTDEPVPAGLPALFGVSCPDNAHCYAVGGSDFIASTNGGLSWTIQSQSGVDLYTVACESDTTCVSSGFNGSGSSPQSFFYTADGGTTWNLTNSSPGGIATYMTCLSSSCIGVGAGLLQTVDGGETWSLVPSTGQNTLFDTDDCLPTTTTCLAVGPNTAGGQQPTLPGELDISTDGGASWTNGPSRQYRYHSPSGLRVLDHLLRDGLPAERRWPIANAHEHQRRYLMDLSDRPCRICLHQQFLRRHGPSLHVGHHLHHRGHGNRCSHFLRHN